MGSTDPTQSPVKKKIKIDESESEHSSKHATSACASHHVECSTSPGTSHPIIEKENICPNSGYSNKKSENVCVICNAATYKKERKLYKINDKDQATQFLKSANHFQDEVFSRVHALNDAQQIMSSELLYHQPCMKTYSLKYKRALENDESSLELRMSEAFGKLMTLVLFTKNGYALENVRETMNKKCDPPQNVTLDMLKKLITDYFQNKTIFCYLENDEQCLFVYPAPKERIEDPPTKDHLLMEAAQRLKTIFKTYNFNLENSFCDEFDLSISEQTFQENRPKEWVEFVNVIFSSYESTEENTRKADILFQVIFFAVNNGRKKTPFHVSSAQAIHDTCKSKILISAFNHAGLCVSYESVQRMDHLLASRIIAQAKNHRVPLPARISNKTPARASTDNWDRKEYTMSGLGESHDTVMVFFQEDTEPIECSVISDIGQFGLKNREKKFETTLECQKLLPFLKPKARGNVQQNFSVCENRSGSAEEIESFFLDRIWLLSRLFVALDNANVQNSEKNFIPSWSAFNSILCQPRGKPIKTKTMFSPVLPHPITDASSVYTAMVNFQDVLSQLNQASGSLWCDEGVYRLAREIKLWFPEKFSNIFLGLGSFHTSKIVMSCLGNYLDGSGMAEILTEQEIFGPNVAESALKGAHYARGIHCFFLIAETMERLLWQKFFEKYDSKKYCFFINCLNEFREIVLNEKIDLLQPALKKLRNHITELCADFDTFAQEGCQKSDMFKYWYFFIKNLFPVLRDMIRSDREGNWALHVSSIRRSLPMFFQFGKINYARWGSLYYEDCERLAQEFPEIYKSFTDGHFVVQHTERLFSSVAMDQALEQYYNNPSKGPGGIIGISRQKESVAQRNLNQQEKTKIKYFFFKMCDLNIDNEYSIHHEFSKSKTIASEEEVEKMMKFISGRRNPFDEQVKQLENIMTGCHFSQQDKSFKLNCLTDGGKLYQQFKTDVFVNKTKTLLSPLHRIKNMNSVTFSKKIVDVKAETISALRTIDIARARGYPMNNLLKWELTSDSFYLTKDGLLKKPQKSDIVQELEKKLPSDAVSKELPPSSLQTATVFDFMLHARIVAAAGGKKFKTFGDLAEAILRRIHKIAEQSSRVDIVFDVYETGSVKESERERRCTAQPILITIGSAETKLLKNMDAFWASAENKIQLQNFFAEYVSSQQALHTNVFIGGLGSKGKKSIRIENGQQVEVQALESELEEADERLFLHIKHAVDSGAKRILLASSDADTFICSIYYFSKVFKDLGLTELWVLCGKSDTTRYVPIHKLVDCLAENFIKILPAVHALSGCDTTSKFSTKRNALKRAIESPQSLENFGITELSSTMIKRAEAFLATLLRVTSTCLDELRLSEFYSMKSIDFSKLPPTSTSTQLHIQRAYYQCFKWYNILNDVTPIDPADYGYFEENGRLLPKTITEKMPPDFPHPCTCKKCTKATVCSCRLQNISCFEFCKCEIKNCSNPQN